MIRTIAKLFAVTLAFAAFVHVGPLFAGNVAYIASNGFDGNDCGVANPCATFQGAANAVNAGGEIYCLISPGPPGSSELGVLISTSVTIDCAGVYDVTLANFGAFAVQGSNTVVKIRNLTISGAFGGFPAIAVQGYSGTLILENCVFENVSGTALVITPLGAFNLVVTNSRISNNSAGVVIKPQAGGSVTATFNGVTVTGNTGGGLKTDTTNGPVSVDISNSTISNNGGNGLNAVSGAGGANMFNIRNSVIARNGSAGVQANGANAAALIDMTLLDSNTAGATSAVAGGRLLTYGNNHIVGSPGSGFTGPAPSQ